MFKQKMNKNFNFRPMTYCLFICIFAPKPQSAMLKIFYKVLGTLIYNLHAWVTNLQAGTNY